MTYRALATATLTGVTLNMAATSLAAQPANIGVIEDMTRCAAIASAKTGIDAQVLGKPTSTRQGGFTVVAPEEPDGKGEPRENVCFVGKNSELVGKPSLSKSPDQTACKAAKAILECLGGQPAPGS